MELRELATMERFSNEKFQKVNLFETPRMFCDLYCFEPGQLQSAHTHRGSDKIYVVLEGHAELTVGSERGEVRAGSAVLIPPGAEHALRNPGPERLVVLVFMAPKPS